MCKSRFCGIGIFLLLALSSAFLGASGCAGPETMYVPTSQVHVYADIPLDSDVEIRPLRPAFDSDPQHREFEACYAIALADEFQKRHLFRSVVVPEQNQPPRCPLVLDVWVKRHEEGGLLRQIVVPAPRSRLILAARLVDRTSGKLLLESENSELGSGGAYGFGGFLAPDEEELGKIMARKMAKDVAELMPDRAGP